MDQGIKRLITSIFISELKHLNNHYLSVPPPIDLIFGEL